MSKFHLTALTWITELTRLLRALTAMTDSFNKRDRDRLVAEHSICHCCFRVPHKSLVSGVYQRGFIATYYKMIALKDKFIEIPEQ